MSGPVLVAVDEDAGVMRDVERELRDRYARHYRVVCIRSPREVLALLEELAADGEQVALVLAGQRLWDMTGGELLDQARHLHPHAKRGLLMAWDSLGTERPARRSSIRLPAVGSTTTWSGRQTIGRGFSSGHLEFAARVGGGAARLPAYDPRDWRVLVRPGL